MYAILYDGDWVDPMSETSGDHCTWFTCFLNSAMTFFDMSLAYEHVSFLLAKASIYDVNLNHDAFEIVPVKVVRADD